MNAQTDLEKEIEKKLAAAENRRRAAQDDMRENMAKIDRDLRRYGEVADRLVRNVICPRIQTMAGYFDSVEFLRPQAEELRHSCICRFRPTARFPANLLLKLAVSHDETFEHLQVTYRVEIEPNCLEVEGRDQTTFPMDVIDEATLGCWVDERLLGFVDTYLRLEEVGPYQALNLVLDPVCGMVINKNHAVGQLEHDGRTYYFCVEECQKKFAEQPSRYAPPSK